MEAIFKDFENYELKYVLNDKFNIMDALVQNKAESEFLNIAYEISKILNVNLEIYTEPIQQGSIKRFFKFNFSKKDIKDVQKDVIIAITTGVTLLLVGQLLSPDSLNEDKEYIALRKQEIRLSIEHLQNELNEDKNYDSLQKIKKSRSNFYESLNVDKRIDLISFDNKYSIQKSEFKNYILTTDELPPKIIEETLIEIVSPVLRKGNYKWKGIFDGESISFYMKSEEFKKLAQDSRIEFKTGFNINSNLIINRKINSDGEITITSFEVTEIYNYFINDKLVETNTGKKKRYEKLSEETQLKIDYEKKQK